MPLSAAPPSILTVRLRLRRPSPADAAPIFARYASDPEVTRYLAWRRHETLADTQTFLDFSDLEWKLQRCGPYLIERRDDQELIGATGLSMAGLDHAETGYVLARHAWGVGYATEALRAMVTLARELGLPALHAQCHPEHHASRRVLEKGGFRLEHRSVRTFVFPNLGGDKQDVLSYRCEW